MRVIKIDAFEALADGRMAEWKERFRKDEQ